jgi:hypothetical protein
MVNYLVYYWAISNTAQENVSENARKMSIECQLNVSRISVESQDSSPGKSLAQHPEGRCLQIVELERDYEPCP